MTDPKGLAPFVGFEEAEVKRLCSRFDMDYSEMARWYDGYVVGRNRLQMYNPRSVAGAIASREYSSFWVSTETYEALQAYIDLDFDGVGADLAFVPKPGSILPPMVVELKWDKPADATIEQIRARNYPAALAELAGECVLVGIAYEPDTCAHSCRIERIIM